MTVAAAVPDHRDGRRRRAVVVGSALAVLLTVTTVPGAPAEAAPLRTNVSAAARQCDMGFGDAKRSDGRKARQLMQGTAKLGKYGWFRLAKNPSWKPVATLDSSGRGHMHSLHYLLPLLRHGVQTGDRAMVKRFYAVLRDWVRDNPPGGPTSRYAWGPPIYEGFRAQVLVCAAAGPQGHRKWLKRAMVRHGSTMADYRRYEGVNNASLHQSMGLYALGKAMRRKAWRSIAISRMASLAVRLIRPDGSDEEGAPHYGANNYRWFNQAAERLRRGGSRVPGELDRVAQIPAFLAQATRPDGRLEALGDTSPDVLSPAKWAGTAAEYAATLGTSGTRPESTFTDYAGGYVFGRSGWGGSRAFTDETFFSVRAGKATPHAHDDSGSVTLYAHGSPLLLDTGQWRYTYGTTRSFVVSRAAHNAVLVHGVPRTRLRPELRTSRTGGLEIATVVDRGYRGVTLTRTVAYDRADDVLVVWDRLDAGKDVRASQQWGLGRDRGVRIDADAVHTTGPGANVSLLFTSGGAPLDIAVGQRNPMRGWNSQSYGELKPSPSLRASQRGRSLSWLTVIAPRAADVNPSTVSATAAVSQSAAAVSLVAPGGSATVHLDDNGGARTAYTPVPPEVKPAADIVRAGTKTAVRATGLTPGQRARFESQAPDGSGLTTVVESSASVAGTLEVSVPAESTTDYRVVSGDAASAWRRVIAAFPPARPTGLVATPTGRGRLDLTWTLPTDTGGAPLTRQQLSVDRKRSWLPADVTGRRLTRLAPGRHKVWVRAGNAVALSPVALTKVDVPVYPKVTAPTKVRKRTLVTLALKGLMPGTRARLTVDPDKGKTLVRRPRVRDDGTAVVRLRLRRSVTVAVTSGGVSSKERRIKVR